MGVSQGRLTGYGRLRIASDRVRCTQALHGGLRTKACVRRPLCEGTCAKTCLRSHACAVAQAGPQSGPPHTARLATGQAGGASSITDVASRLEALALARPPWALC